MISKSPLYTDEIEGNKKVYGLCRFSFFLNIFFNGCLLWNKLHKFFIIEIDRIGCSNQGSGDTWFHILKIMLSSFRELVQNNDGPWNHDTLECWKHEIVSHWTITGDWTVVILRNKQMYISQIGKIPFNI